MVVVVGTTKSIRKAANPPSTPPPANPSSPCTLDFGGLAPAIVVTPGASLTLSSLVLTGLAPLAVADRGGYRQPVVRGVPLSPSLGLYPNSTVGRGVRGWRGVGWVARAGAAARPAAVARARHAAAHPRPTHRPPRPTLSS